MASVLHALPERDEVTRRLHLEHWYGTLPPDVDEFADEEYPVVCWCGGRNFLMSDDVYAVWHVREFNVEP